ncbi:uncharacterized protein NPIL_268691 [Nephila pilipes]|uniref:Uncharacterized protein n=1 Tax=Nephila pilipes TaxID=299642 RepID=A0A8X6NIU3_NEPPI|nr:uncharacterized protein NPIL_268691 [Nephila pilipes]
MEASEESLILSMLFEHACKKEFNGVLQNTLQTKDLAFKIHENSSSSESGPSEKIKINPLFMLIYILKKFLNSLESFSKISKSSGILMLPSIIGLLESTYQQYSFISLKKYFTLTSELRLFDLINYIIDDSDSSLVVQKLNKYFPRWNEHYKKNIEQTFHIKNSKILDKVEESHTQCRRLILRLAMDKSYRNNYLSEHYANDIRRLMKESRESLSEIIDELESCAGSSSLEEVVNAEKNDSSISNDLSFQMLLDYIQPEISEEALVKFLDDFDPMLCSQAATGLSSCLLPIETMSEISDDEDSEDTDESESEEKSEDGENSREESCNGTTSNSIIPIVDLGE